MCNEPAPKVFFLLSICWLLASALPPHPMLYFDASDVPTLREKAKTSHAKIARKIHEAGKSLKENPNHYLPPKNHAEFASKWNEVYGNNLCAFAMYCVLYPEDITALKLVSNSRMQNFNQTSIYFFLCKSSFSSRSRNRQETSFAIK